MIKPLLFLSAALLAGPSLANSADTGPPTMPQTMPMCSATVKDGCMQTKGQEARAMNGAQADARDAKSGAWTPNGGMSDKDAAMPMKMSHHKMMKHMAKTTTTTTTEAAPK